MLLAPGALVNGYRIVTEVGRGGMGVVYRAHQVRLGRDVALKVLPSTLVEDPNLHTRLLREARAVASLHHPAILVIHDVGDYEGAPYLVTELIEGGTVAQYRGSPQPLANVLLWLGPVAEALDYAHAQGILHRDVKPANILLRPDGSPVLADFGLALAAGVDARLTRTGLMMGTPEYMAPEQALQTAEALSPAVDHYALAIIAYELLTGRVPFSDPWPLAVAMAHVEKAPPPPRSLNSAIAPGVEAALLRGLAKDPRDRFPSAMAFIEALAAGERAAVPATLARSDVPAPVSPALPVGVAGAQAATVVNRGGIAAMAGARRHGRVVSVQQRRTRLVAGIGLLGALAAAGTAFALHADGRRTVVVTPPATATSTYDSARMAQMAATVDRSQTATAIHALVAPTGTRISSPIAVATHIPPTHTPTPSSTDTGTPMPPTSTRTPDATPVRPTGTPAPIATFTRTPVPPSATTAPTNEGEPSWAVALAAHHITTVAGNGVRRIDSTGATVGTYSGNGGPARQAGLSRPFGVAVDQAGNLIIADTFNNRIRKVAAGTGTITTIADNGDYHYSGDGGPATAAGISPNNVALDRAGNLYIADAANYRIRKVSVTTGTITTVAGNGAFGDSGDGGPATQAAIGFPNYVTVDRSGNLYFADFGTERVRKVAWKTGIITTVAGNGTRSRDSGGNIVGAYSGDGGPASAAALNHPTCVVVDRAGNLYIADRDNYRVRKVDAATGVITTVAGTGSYGFSGDGGPAASGTLAQPSGLALDMWGNLYIADTGNNRVRMVAATTGIITTIAGNGAAGDGGERGPATQAALNRPLGLALDRMGNLYIADTDNNRVRVVRGVAGPVRP